MGQANPDMDEKYIAPIVDAFIDSFVMWKEMLKAWGYNDNITNGSHYKYLCLQELVQAYDVDVSNLREEAQAVIDAIEEG